MNNLYHKIAVASICTAIGLTLGTSEEVKAATITLIPTIQYGLNSTYNYYSGVDTRELSSQYNRVSRRYADLPARQNVTSKLAEFDVSSFFPNSNTIIKSAVFQDRISRFEEPSPVGLGLWGYTGSGIASSVWRGEYNIGINLSSFSPGDVISFDVTKFVNDTSGYAFAGFLLAPWASGEVTLEGTDALGRSRLVIETADVAQPVPEPTTIFGSVLALGVGRWLKRKKSNLQNKTTS